MNFKVKAFLLYGTDNMRVMMFRIIWTLLSIGLFTLVKLRINRLKNYI